MDYQIKLPDCDCHHKLKKINLLAQNPQLHINYNVRTKEIHVQLMGEIQIECLKI